MEGIADGRAVDDCFHCALLYPRECRDDCPGCGRRMRWQPASMVSEVALSEQLDVAVAEYEAVGEVATRREALLALLVLLHRYAPVALALLADRARAGGPDLERLRRDYEALGGAG
ncbi:hypothetical protein [Haliangium sp.]|uniref:hypothetical protein n=1 Tax=Haliangium sp. TaxID=2663208 RepID=UPI003D127F86